MNLFSLAKEFPTESDALEYWIKTRWPDGIRCVECNHSKVYRIETTGKTGKSCLVLECAKCGLHFSPTAGTLFHDSHLPLQKWFACIALMCEAKKGVSANQISRHIGVTYKTAWYLCHRIRKAMSEEPSVMGGQGQIVEIDESFIGGNIRGGGVDGKKSKIKVFGVAERGGRVHLRKIKNLKKETLQPLVDAMVSPNASKVITDGAYVYRSLIPKEKHIAGNHFQEIRKGEAITNKTIEGAFSLFKRGVVGNYHKIGEEHMDAYLGEFCWRYNRRKHQPEMFNEALKRLNQAPLPYSKLKGGDNPF
ncbi:IS1595 family transposase [Acidicapsa ligni]|uniref:IS1595 family transposase n=1 Tax=Acidicapsa ligni TaxID=542300 RepID=UPI0021E0AE68|nr:IS1595 family transposase [Acidicapsa ligni]